VKLAGDVKYVGKAPNQADLEWFLESVAELMRKCRVSKVDLCWAYAPPEETKKRIVTEIIPRSQVTLCSNNKSYVFYEVGLKKTFSIIFDQVCSIKSYVGPSSCAVPLFVPDQVIEPEGDDWTRIEVRNDKDVVELIGYYKVADLQPSISERIAHAYSCSALSFGAAICFFGSAIFCLAAII
jgi:hypothetical protein